MKTHTYNKPTRVNAGREDGNFYHSEQTVILELMQVATFMGQVI
jgi:hypothetical protein